MTVSFTSKNSILLKVHLLVEVNMTNLVIVNQILGVRQLRDRKTLEGWITQKSYGERALCHFSIQDVKPSVLLFFILLSSCLQISLR